MTLPSPRRSFGLRLSLITTMLAVVGALIAVSPAEAAPPPPDSKIAQANDAYVKSQCRFTTTSANYAAGTVRGRLTTKVSWAGAAGFKNIVEVGLDCFLYEGDTFTEVGQIGRTAPGRAIYDSRLLTVPLATKYIVCVQASYKLRNGSSGFVSTSCA